jgi:hypothetical protein
LLILAFFADDPFALSARLGRFLGFFSLAAEVCGRVVLACLVCVILTGIRTGAKFNRLFLFFFACLVAELAGEFWDNSPVRVARTAARVCCGVALAATVAVARAASAAERYRFRALLGIVVGASAAILVAEGCRMRAGDGSAVAYAVSFSITHVIVFLLLILHWPVRRRVEQKTASN